MYVFWLCTWLAVCIASVLWECCVQFVTLCNLQNALHNLGMVRIRGYGSGSRLEVGLGLGLGSDQQFANCVCAISKLRILQTAQTDISCATRTHRPNLLMDKTLWVFFFLHRHCFRRHTIAGWCCRIGTFTVTMRCRAKWWTSHRISCGCCTSVWQWILDAADWHKTRHGCKHARLEWMTSKMPALVPKPHRE